MCTYSCYIIYKKNHLALQKIVLFEFFVTLKVGSLAN